MSQYVSTLPIQFLLTVGDHFYPLDANTPDDPRWIATFESLYNDYNLGYLQYLR